MRLFTLAVAAHAWLAALALVSPPAHRWSAAPPAPRRPTALRSTTTRDTDAEPITIETVDDLLDAPQVNCARGVCVIDETEPEVCEFDEDMEEIICVPAETPLWPKALLLGSSVLYGTNFALGRLMNDALPAAASTSARFVLAGVALFPFLLRLAPNLRRDALICGCFTALGYVTQSLALVDTPAATVAFLGALTVVVCPTCAFLVEKRTDLGFRDAPQVWVAAILALVGVGFLELPSVLAGGGDLLSAGDALSVLQAVGFGTSFYLTERMMQKEPTQALSITAAQVSVTAFISAVWAFCDGYGLGPFDGGWLLDDTLRATHTIPGLFLDPSLRAVAAAAAWTGLVTTAANRVAETTALGQVTSSEASVLLATEPLWAAVFGALLINEALEPEDIAGGALICAACVTAAQDRDTMRRFLRLDESSREDTSSTTSKS